MNDVRLAMALSSSESYFWIVAGEESMTLVQTLVIWQNASHAHPAHILQTTSVVRTI